MTLPGVCVSVLHGHGRGVRVVMVVVVVMVGGVGSVVGGHGGVVAQAGGGHGGRRGRVGRVAAVLPYSSLAGGVGRDDGRDGGRRRRRGHHGVGGGVHGRVERVVMLDLRHTRRGVRRVRQGAGRNVVEHLHSEELHFLSEVFTHPLSPIWNRLGRNVLLQHLSLPYLVEEDGEEAVWEEWAAAAATAAAVMLLLLMMPPTERAAAEAAEEAAPPWSAPEGVPAPPELPPPPPPPGLPSMSSPAMALWSICKFHKQPFNNFPRWIRLHAASKEELHVGRG